MLQRSQQHIGSMVGKSVSGAGGGRASLAKAKQHFFKDLDLNTVVTPSDDAPGAFTGRYGLQQSQHL